MVMTGGSQKMQGMWYVDTDSTAPLARSRRRRDTWERDDDTHTANRQHTHTEYTHRHTHRAHTQAHTLQTHKHTGTQAHRLHVDAQQRSHTHTLPNAL